MAETPRLASLIARAVVHLNFNEPDEAQHALLEALTEFNWGTQFAKEITDGNRTTAA